MPSRRPASIRRAALFFAVLVFPFLSNPPAPAEDSPVPDDFPRFIVPGFEREMEALRELHWLHYVPAGPLATLWDEWLPGPTLWPGVETGGATDSIRTRWAEALSNRGMDPEGYVHTHQHASIAHQEGWPFPSWTQGQPLAWGWHFSLEGVTYAWVNASVKTQEGWTLEGAADRGVSPSAWDLELTSPGAAAAAPPMDVPVDNAPFIQVRWRGEALAGAEPFLEWSTAEAEGFAPERRMYFDPPPAGASGFTYAMIPVYRSPEWKGRITRLRLNFGNRKPGPASLQAIFTQYDTRHTINNSFFIRGCAAYFHWTRDLNFLRANIQRIRRAFLYMAKEFGAARSGVVEAPWVGHDGRSGLEFDAAGKKIIHPGRGIGGNYWDLLPFGGKDALATVYYHAAAKTLAGLEREIAANPAWNIPGGPSRLGPDSLDELAERSRKAAGELFWNPATGRFMSSVGADGKARDYGFTFLNLEAVYYGLATPEQAKSITDWIAGDREVAADDSQGADIYHWRFGPRATTKRNVEYYMWAWSHPEGIPFGGQIQDGGAVLGFSHFDVMARLQTRGPDDAWARFKATLDWFAEVQAEGGYRAYYAKDPARGTLQGGGPPGGLGMDREFFESLLVPQMMIEGFLGFRAAGEGFELDPRLPAGWPSLEATRIHLHNAIFDVKVQGRRVEIKGRTTAPGPPPQLLGGGWKAAEPVPPPPPGGFSAAYER